VVLVTGVSGSGKSTAMTALEDAGFYGAETCRPGFRRAFSAVRPGQPIQKIALAPLRGDQLPA
jgi:UPF0042 nucleotide-binding protein